MKIKFEVKGLKELEDKLMQLADGYGPKAGVQAMRPALKAAVGPLEATIQTSTPKDSGNLAASTKTRIGKPTKKMLQSEYIDPNSVIVAQVGWMWSKPSLWDQALAVEFGTSEMSGSATLRNAIDSHAEQIIDDFGAALGPAIEKKAKALGKKRSR